MTDGLPEMRASDADRDRIAELLRDAYSEGRLDTDEFEERLEATYQSRTRGELEPLVRDLPQPSSPSHPPSGPPAAVPGRRWAHRFGGEPTSRGGVAVFGGFARKGAWTAPRVFTCVALWGGGDIDLREARFEDHEMVIRATAIMGGVHVTVPHDAEVVVEGLGIMGSFDHTATGVGAPDAPRIVITGFAFWGGVGVQRKHPEGEKGKEELDSGG